MSDYAGVPTFQEGQVISASGHLNTLGQALLTLYEHQLGSYTGFCGGTLRAADGGGYRWHGFMRNKGSNLYFHYSGGAGTFTILKTDPGGDITLYTQTYGGGTPLTYRTGYIDLTGLVDEDDFYELVFEGPADAVLYMLAEVDDAVSFPDVYGPGAGADHWGVGGIPTAARWNSLSQYVDLVSHRIIHPRALCVPSFYSGDRTRLFAGEWVHHCQYLSYQVYINGTTVHIEIGLSDGAGGWDWTEIATLNTPGLNQALVDDATAIDLEAIDFGGGRYLLKGESYLLAVEVTDAPEDTRLNWIREMSDTTPSMPGWVAIPTWNGISDYVDGESGLKQVKTLIDAAALLRNASRMANCPMRVREGAGESMLGNDNAVHMIRRHRFLHVLSNDLDIQPTLLFYRDERYTKDTPADESTDGYAHSKGDAKETEVGIENKTDPFGNLIFHSIDLDTIAGLWPGTEYRIRDIHCAIEDIEG